jgi:hypothetical protein
MKHSSSTTYQGSVYYSQKQQQFPRESSANQDLSKNSHATLDIIKQKFLHESVLPSTSNELVHTTESNPQVASILCQKGKFITKEEPLNRFSSYEQTTDHNNHFNYQISSKSPVQSELHSNFETNLSSDANLE